MKVFWFQKQDTYTYTHIHIYIYIYMSIYVHRSLSHQKKQHQKYWNFKKKKPISYIYITDTKINSALFFLIIYMWCSKILRILMDKIIENIIIDN